MATEPRPDARGGRSRTRKRAVVAATALAIAVLMLTALPSGAVHGGIDTEPLTGRHEFTDDISGQIRLKPEGRPREVLNLADASNLMVVEITIPPGERFPWHTHPAPVLAAVAEGDLVYIYADDCVERDYPEGTAFVDPGGDNVHTAYNPGDEDAVVIATLIGAPDDGPVTLPVDDAQQAELDERCS